MAKTKTDTIIDYLQQGYKDGSLNDIDIDLIIDALNSEWGEYEETTGTWYDWLKMNRVMYPTSRVEE